MARMIGEIRTFTYTVSSCLDCCLLSTSNFFYPLFCALILFQPPQKPHAWQAQCAQWSAA